MELVREWQNALVCCIQFSLEAPASTPDASRTPESSSLLSEDSSATNSPLHHATPDAAEDPAVISIKAGPAPPIASPVQFIGAVLTILSNSVHGGVIVPSVTRSLFICDLTDENVQSLLQALLDVSADVSCIDRGFDGPRSSSSSVPVLCSNGYGVVASFGLSCGPAAIWRATLASAGNILVGVGRAVQQASSVAAELPSSDLAWTISVHLSSSEMGSITLSRIAAGLNGMQLVRRSASALTLRPSERFLGNSLFQRSGSNEGLSGSRSFSFDDLAAATGGEAALRALDKLVTSDAPHCLFVVCRVRLHFRESSSEESSSTGGPDLAILTTVARVLTKIHTIAQLAGGGICDVDTETGRRPPPPPESSSDASMQQGSSITCTIHCALPMRKHSWRSASSGSGSHDDRLQAHSSSSLEAHGHRAAECAFAVLAGIRHVLFKDTKHSSIASSSSLADEALPDPTFAVVLVAGCAAKVLLRRSNVLVGSEAYFVAAAFLQSQEQRPACLGEAADEVACDVAVAHLLEHYRTAMAVTPAADSSHYIIRSQRSNTTAAVATIQRFAEMYCRRHHGHSGAIFWQNDVSHRVERIISEHTACTSSASSLFRCAVVIGGPRSAKTSLLLSLAAKFSVFNTILVDCRTCRSMAGVSSPVEMASPVSPLAGVRHRTSVTSTPILCAVYLQLKAVYQLRGAAAGSRSKPPIDVCSASTTVAHVADAVEALLCAKWHCRDGLLILLDDLHYAEDDNHTIPILAKLAKSTAVPICIIATSQRSMLPDITDRAASNPFGRVSPLPEALIEAGPATCEATQIFIPDTVSLSTASSILRQAIGRRTLQTVLAVLEPSPVVRWPSTASDNVLSPSSGMLSPLLSREPSAWTTASIDTTPERSPVEAHEAKDDAFLSRLDRLVYEAAHGMPFLVSVLGRALRSPDKLLHVLSLHNDIIARTVLEDLLATQAPVADLTAELLAGVHVQEGEWLCHVALWACASSHQSDSLRGRSLTLQQLELLAALDSEDEWDIIEERHLSWEVDEDEAKRVGASSAAACHSKLQHQLLSSYHGSQLSHFVRFNGATKRVELQPLFVPLALVGMMSKRAVATAAERLLDCTQLDLSPSAMMWCALCCGRPAPRRLVQELRLAQLINQSTTQSQPTSAAAISEWPFLSVLHAWAVTPSGSMQATSTLAHLSVSSRVPDEVKEAIQDWPALHEFAEHTQLLENRRKKSRKVTRSNLAAVYVPSNVADIDVAVEEFIADAAHLARSTSVAGNSLTGSDIGGRWLPQRVRDSWALAAAALHALMSVEGPDPQLAKAIKDVTSTVEAWVAPQGLAGARVSRVDPNDLGVPLRPDMADASAPLIGNPVARLSSQLRDISSVASQIAKDTCSTATQSDDSQFASKVGLSKVQTTVLQLHLSVLLALLESLCKEVRVNSRKDDVLELSAADVIQQATSLLLYQFLFEESLMASLQRHVDAPTRAAHWQQEGDTRKQQHRQHLLSHEKLLGTVCALGGELATGRAQLAADLLEVLVHMMFVHMRHSDAALSELIRSSIGNLTDDNLSRAYCVADSTADGHGDHLAVEPFAAFAVVVPMCSPDEAIPAAPRSQGHAPGPVLPTSGKGWVPKKRVASAPPPSLD
jgi:hypothetical protein